MTDLAIKKLPLSKDGQITYWDQLTPNFGIRCSVKSKSFVVLLGEKRKRKTLGRYPALSLAEARKQAKHLLSLEALTPHAIQSQPYSVIRDDFLEDCQHRLRPSTIKGYTHYLGQIDFAKNIDAIDQNDILRKINAHTKGQSSQNHAFVALKVFFNWAIARGYISQKPLQALKRPHHTESRERVLSDEELKNLLSYCQKDRDRFKDIVTLLIYTGQRKGEITNLEWQDIGEKTITLPASKVKNKRQHQFPLSKHAKELIHSLEGGVQYVFGTPVNDTPFNGFGKATKKMLGETGIDHFTLHDLRRTFATIHARIGTPIHMTEKLLNHVSGTISGVAAVYNRHSYMEEMRAAMKNYDDFLESLINS